MKDSPLKKTIYIKLKLLTGIILMIYVSYHIYACSMAASQLNIIPFMAGCIAIVITGFGFAALYEYATNKKRTHEIARAPIRQLLEGVLIAIVIAIICSIIYLI